MIELPSHIEERISAISARTGINEGDITKDYEELFNDPSIQSDEQFSSDEDRHSYAIGVLWTRYVLRPPVQEYDIIPVGFSSAGITQGGTPQSTVYVLTKSGLRRLVLRGEQSYQYKDVTLLAQYKNIYLGEFKGGDLIADSRTKFENPIATGLTPKSIIERLKIKRVLVTEVSKSKSLSKVDSTGYVDSTDWKVVRGILAKHFTGTRDDGTEYGVCTIADETVDQEPTVTPDGRIIYPGISAWIAPELLVYPDESWCDFVGTLQKGKKAGDAKGKKTGEVSMNCYMISPIYIREIEQGGE
ncbi:unnamed protein product [marine sediment metagenome]|uniref:Uncharacterized protein n=1 Tax=marine sediment metagenome TaxID=412755 RepID=X1KYX2_9ZZZZ